MSSITSKAKQERITEKLCRKDDWAEPTAGDTSDRAVSGGASPKKRYKFINHTVARLLDKLLVEQTKSRPRRSNDNGLVESKSGAVVRWHMGYGHIEAAFSSSLNFTWLEWEPTVTHAPVPPHRRAPRRHVQLEGTDSCAGYSHWWNPLQDLSRITVLEFSFLPHRSRRRRPLDCLWGSPARQSCLSFYAADFTAATRS